MKILKKIHQKMPRLLQKIYMPPAAKCSYLIQKFINLVYPPIFIYEGKERKSKAFLSFAYAGFHQTVENYWAGLVLAEGFQKRALPRQWVWNIPSLIRNHVPHCSFLLLEHQLWSLRLVPSMSGFRVPYWVTMDIDVSSPAEELMGEQKIKTRKLMFENGLSYEVTRNLKDFEDYYFNMFLPYVRDRYARTLSLESQEAHFKIFSKGELVLVKKRGEPVGGGLIEFKDKKAKLRTIGVRDGNREYVQQGVLAAVYYSVLYELKNKGYRKVHIGGTRPFFSDGVTRYKTSLGARLTPEILHSCVWMTFLDDSAILREFLAGNSFIFINEHGQQCRAVFWDPGTFPQQKEFDSIVRLSRAGGCREAHLFILGDFKRFSDKISYSNIPSVIVKPIQEVMTPFKPAEESLSLEYALGVKG